MRTTASEPAQRPAGAVGQELQLAGTLEVIEVVEGPGHRTGGDDDAMIGQEQHGLVAQRRAHALALRIVWHRAAVVVVIGDPAVEFSAGLADPVERATGGDEKRRRLRHVPCMTQVARALPRWIREWMKKAVASAAPPPASTLPAASTSSRSPARISDQCSP
jgi:hypothetical protein